MTETELADSLEERASQLIDDDPDTAEMLLAIADEYRAGSRPDAAEWKAAS